MMAGVYSRKLAIVAVSGCATILVFVAPSSSWTGLMVLAFLMICPGLAIVSLFRLQDMLAELTLGVAISLALIVLVGQVLVYSGAWSGKIGAAILILVTLSCAWLPTINARQETQIHGKKH